MRKTEKMCQRVGTVNVHKSEEMDRQKVKGWRKIIHPKESTGDYIIPYKIKTKTDMKQKLLYNDIRYKSPRRYKNYKYV